MALAERIYYTLAEVAIRWQVSEDDLLHWGAKGDLRLAFWCSEAWAYYTDKQNQKHILSIKEQFLYADEKSILQIMLCDSTEVHRAKPIGQRLTMSIGGNADTILYFKDGFGITEGPIYCGPEAIKPIPQINRRSLVILPDELTRMEDEHPEAAIHQDPSTSVQSGNISTKNEPMVSRGTVLTGWKMIAGHMNCSTSTARRHARGKKWLTRSPSGKPTAYTLDIDSYMTSGKK